MIESVLQTAARYLLAATCARECMLQLLAPPRVEMELQLHERIRDYEDNTSSPAQLLRQIESSRVGLKSRVFSASLLPCICRPV